VARFVSHKQKSHSQVCQKLEKDNPAAPGWLPLRWCYFVSKHNASGVTKHESVLPLNTDLGGTHRPWLCPTHQRENEAKLAEAATARTAVVDAQQLGREEARRLELQRRAHVPGD